MTTRGVSWDRLDDLVPDELDDYWQLTLKFLQIAIKQWPEILRERGVIEAAEAARSADQGGSRAPCAQDRRRR